MKDFVKVYDKYIFKQVFLATMVAILLFIVVWIAPEILLKVINNVLTGEYTLKTGIMVLICEIPKILGKAFPVGLLLGTLFTFDKLSKDSELTIFRAVGMSFGRILRPILAFSILVTGICFITYDKLIPYSCKKLIEIKHQYYSTQFIYTQKDENNHPREAIIVSKYFNNNMKGIIVLNFAEEIYDDLHGLNNVVVAESGKKGLTKDGKPCWHLYNITSYDIDDNGIFKLVQKIEHKDVLIGEAAENAHLLMSYTGKRDREINNKNLKRYVNLLKKEGLDEEYRLNSNKYIQRFLHPIICILLAVLGCILGFSRPREQRLVGFTIAIGCIFAYYITLPFFDLLAKKGVLLPFLAAAFPPIAFIIAIILFYKFKEL